MSLADAAFGEMDAVLFDTFGEAVAVQRGTDAAVAVRVVLERGVERLGDYGQVAGRVTTASFLNSEWIPKPGDVLQLASGDRKVEAIDRDDGKVTVAVLYG